jgi:hypothetical protein
MVVRIAPPQRWDLNSRETFHHPIFCHPIFLPSCFFAILLEQMGWLSDSIYLPGGSEELRGFGFWSLLGLTQAEIHPKTAEANHGDAETRRKTD